MNITETDTQQEKSDFDYIAEIRQLMKDLRKAEKEINFWKLVALRAHEGDPHDVRKDAERILKYVEDFNVNDIKSIKYI